MMKEEIKTKSGAGKRPISWKKKIIIGIVIILMMGITYEQTGEYSDEIKYPPSGQLVTVNGHQLHLFAEGEGSPTVVFAAGWKTPSPYVDFYPLYSQIAKDTRTLVYDRPGYGWSEMTDSPRDIDRITEEIHLLLEKAGEKPPYILVGHSIGSLEVLRFAQLYPDEVRGVVLIDGSNPEMYQNMVKPSRLAFIRADIFNTAIFLLNKGSVTRLLFNLLPDFYSSTALAEARNNLSLAPEEFKKIDQAAFLKTFNNGNQVEEGRNKEKNAATVAANGYLTDVPLRIFSSEELMSYPEAAENQTNLIKWSRDSRQTIIKGAGHAVHWAHPETIVSEIKEML